MVNFHLRFIVTLPNFDMTKHGRINIYQTKAKVQFQIKSSDCAMLEFEGIVGKGARIIRRLCLLQRGNSQQETISCSVIIQSNNSSLSGYKGKPWSWQKITEKSPQNTAKYKNSGPCTPGECKAPRVDVHQTVTSVFTWTIRSHASLKSLQRTKPRNNS